MAAARAVMGRLSWQTDLDQVDPLLVSAGLNGSTSKVLAAFAAAKADRLTVAEFRERLLAMAKG
jgi:hypothetical protein